METINEILHGIIFEVVLKAAISRVVAAVPFLAWPIINPVFSFIVVKFVEIFYDELSKSVAFQVINFQTEEQRKAYSDAVTQLQAAIEKPKEEQNAEDIEKAKAELKARLKDLISLKPK